MSVEFDPSVSSNYQADSSGWVYGNAPDPAAQADPDAPLSPDEMRAQAQDPDQVQSPDQAPPPQQAVPPSPDDPYRGSSVDVVV